MNEHLALIITAGIAIGSGLVLMLAAFRHRAAARRRTQKPPTVEDAIAFIDLHRKPEWVRRKILYLATHLDSCRQIAHTFNRWHGGSVSVGKTWVWEFTREHRAEIDELRRKRRRRQPAPFDVGHTWALDLTFVPNDEGGLWPVLGIIDSGSRKVLCLKRLASKCTFMLLGHLFLALARFGAPRAIRTDNEGMFASHLWARALALISITHRRGPPGQPWRNGRIERLFGTLKPLLGRFQASDRPSLDKLLAEFGWFYNRLRPHQALGGLTPDECWQGMTMQDVQRVHRGARGGWILAIGGQLAAYCPVT